VSTPWLTTPSRRCASGATKLKRRRWGEREMNDLSLGAPRISDKYGFRVDLLIRLAPAIVKLGGADYPVHMVDCIPAQLLDASPPAGEDSSREERFLARS
jgi:hypothetical protein